MHPRSNATIAVITSAALTTSALAWACAAPLRAQALRDGKRFDPGATMTARADGAPEQLDRVQPWVGTWDVDYTRFHADGRASTQTGQAVVTFMNRGHAFLERFHCADFDNAGNELNTVAFLVFNPANAVWALGEANSFTEQISLLSGDFEAGSELVLRHASRRRGGLVLSHYEVRMHIDEGEHGDGDRIEFSWSESNDNGTTWRKTLVKSYRRRAEPVAIFEPASDYGTPAPDLPPEARQFDFLIGEWNMAHDMTFANGNTVQFPANGTAVYALNGHAVMEFSWYDVDPQLPDAATTIVRLYNRQMRRWECMYSTNRFNGILYFGGVREGDQIILHQFEANAADSPISYWTFHDMRKGSYGWYANTSRDRGQTFEKTWIIRGERREPARAGRGG